MIEHFILYTFIALAASVFIFFLNKSARQKTVADENHTYTLGMNKMYGILGALGIFLGLFLLIYLPLTADAKETETPVITAILVAFFWVLGVPILLTYKNHQLVIKEDAIVVTNLIGRVKTMQWEEIQSIQLNILSGLVIVYSKKSFIRISPHLVGFKTFRELAETKTNLTVPG